MDRVVDVTTARRQFGTLLDEVFHKKDVVVIQRKGKSLAKIVPIDHADNLEHQQPHISPQQQILLDELKSLPTISMQDDPVTVLRAIRKKKRIQSQKQYGE